MKIFDIVANCPLCKKKTKFYYHMKLNSYKCENGNHSFDSRNLMEISMGCPDNFFTDQRIINYGRKVNNSPRK